MNEFEEILNKFTEGAAPKKDEELVKVANQLMNISKQALSISERIGKNA